MACEQCNIIYANADVPEVNIDQIRAIARNLREIGVSIVLLIGGEPFVRKDLPEITRTFLEHGIHVRLQTNGLASRELLKKCVDDGGRDISISLDSLNVETQEAINGGSRNSYIKMMQSIADVNTIFPKDGTAFFGTVLMPRNYQDIPNLIRFATAIGWGVSLVPVHVSTTMAPLGFRTYDERLRFPKSLYGKVAEVLNECRQLRNAGYNLYDSDEYLDDIYRFIINEPVQWRRRGGGVCDSPNLYFAIEPDGNIAPCCDYRLRRSIPTYHPDFPKWYRERIVHAEIRRFTIHCPGCMYGSYPEITLTTRFFRPLFQRTLYFSGRCPRLKAVSVEELLALADSINRGDNISLS
jgi:MoaA/NifB/PqqE/SkfB family radical SAM enzyme